MCGPPDFAALDTCIIRLAELSAAGITGYSVYKTASFCRRLRPKREEPEVSGAPNMPGGLLAEGSSEHANP